MTAVLMYIAITAYVLGLTFALLTFKWLRDNPVLPLNWEYERKYHQPVTRRDLPMNFTQVYAASASCAIPLIEYRRAMEQRYWR